MENTYIKSFSSYLPKHCIDQKQALDWIAFMHAETIDTSIEKQRLSELLSKVGLGKDKIQNRYFQMSDILHYDKSQMSVYGSNSHSKGSSLQKKMQLYLEETLHIFKHFYQESDLPKNIIHVSCTGYVSPSPAQTLASEKNANDTTITHAYHMGCYGAFPALRIAKGFTGSCDIVHTEFCSLHMDPFCHTVGQLVIESLFADGFIKYEVSPQQNTDEPALQIITLKERIIKDSTASMKWECADGGFGMFLSKDVPIKIARELSPYLSSLANEAQIPVDHLIQNALFAIHPGGPKIIEQVKELFNLSDHQIQHSKDVLKNRGNMSSATLPHVWQRMLSDPKIPPSTYIVSMAFGPGLTISGGIFQKTG